MEEFWNHTKNSVQVTMKNWRTTQICHLLSTPNWDPNPKAPKNPMNSSNLDKGPLYTTGRNSSIASFQTMRRTRNVTLHSNIWVQDRMRWTILLFNVAKKCTNFEFSIRLDYNAKDPWAKRRIANHLKRSHIMSYTNLENIKENTDWTILWLAPNLNCLQRPRTQKASLSKTSHMLFSKFSQSKCKEGLRNIWPEKETLNPISGALPFGTSIVDLFVQFQEQYPSEPQ